MGVKMKRFFYSIIVISAVLSFSNVTVFAQGEESAVKNNLTNLFNYSKTKAFEKAASIIAYEGDDAARNKKDVFNSSNKDELNQVKRICKKISALIELSSKYEFGTFASKTVDGINIYSIDVQFISGDQKLVTSFTFTKTEKGILFSNMN
jgi:hypothetical protein